MPRVRADNDNRYVLRTSLVDGEGNVIEGDKITIRTDRNVDGGSARAVYLPKQLVSGGRADNG